MRYLFKFFLILTIVEFSHARQPVAINIAVNNNQRITYLPTLTDFPQIQQALTAAQNHKAIVAAAVIGFSYLATLFYVQRAQWLVRNTQSWCNWQHITPLEQLTELSQSEVYAQLKKSFEDRYYNQKPNTIAFLAQFFSETNDELATLQRYLSLEKAVSTFWLAKLFLINDSSVRTAHEAIRRLTFLRSVVATELEPHDVVRRLYLINSPCLGNPV